MDVLIMQYNYLTIFFSILILFPAQGMQTTGPCNVSNQEKKALILLSFLYQVKLFQEYDHNHCALTKALENWSKENCIKCLGYDCAPVACFQDSGTKLNVPEGS